MRIKKKLALILAPTCWVPDCGNEAARRGTPSAVAAERPPTAQSANEAQELRSIVESGRMAELQWPNFSDYNTYVTKFYDQGSYQLEWSHRGKPTAQALEVIGILGEAEEKGLDSKDYDGERWAGRLKTLDSSASPSEDTLAKFDVALTVSLMRYISDVHLGKVDPKILHRDFDLERHKYDLAEFLRQRVVSSSDVRGALQGVEPPYPGYQRTLAALHKYLQMAKEEVPEPLPMVSVPIEAGQNYEELPQLVKRLDFLGDLPPDANIATDSFVYQGTVVEAVRRFQDRHGLEAAGKLGPQTITELNRPMSDRLVQLRLTLERWRWVPHNFEAAPIVVNIPEFLLRAYDLKGHPVLSMRVVVGRAMRTDTPVLQEDMKYVIFWPHWNVPQGILRKEILPQLAKDPDYLKNNDYEVVTFTGELVTEDAVSAEVLRQLRVGKLMVRQKPGLKNALGMIKFIFPNDENVYLHATPSVGLFAKSRRDFSHGCVRVEKPLELAEWVLRNNPGWTRARIDEAFETQKELQVNLVRAIPVLMVYGTAVVPEDGSVHFLEDIYGHDRQLEKLFTEAYESRK